MHDVLRALVPLVVLVIGILTYALSTNGKVVELGRLAYVIGLMWLVYIFATNSVRLAL